MDDRLNLIYSRRSIRKFTGEKISDFQLNELLTAAMAAPSACKKDPWHFITVQDDSTLEKITEFLPNGPFLKNAGTGIVVCGDIKQAHTEALSYMIQDCSAAIENILIAAHGIDLATCWLGVHPREERITALKQLFSLPENIIPIAVIAVGYGAEKGVPGSRFNSELIHQERW